MNVTWIVENISKESSYTELAEAVKKQNFTLIEINGDYKKNILSRFDDFDPDVYNRHCIIFNGSIEMAKLVKMDLSGYCYPVIYSNFEKYLCSNYYSYFGEYLFNDKYTLVALSQLMRNKFFYYGVFGKEGVIFVRPDSGEKSFQAQLVDLQDLGSFYKQNEHLKYEWVLLSTPKNIRWEGRVICSEKEIISYSTYRYQGQITKIPSIPQGAIDLANELLKVGYYPDPVFCYDLCEADDGKFYLLELTSFSSAGLYASNKEKIVQKVSEIAWKDFNND